MTTDHAGFILAIAANPADSLARDAYLDWLTERDDPRAEFIRVQEELENRRACYSCCTPSDCCRLESLRGGFHEGNFCRKHANADARSTELLTTHERDWRGAMVCGTCNGYRCTHGPKLLHPTGCVCCPDCRGTGHEEENIKVTFRRGFVHTVRAPLDTLLAPGVAETIGRYHPVERVEVSDREPMRWTPYSGSASSSWPDRFSWINEDEQIGYTQGRDRRMAVVPGDVWAELAALPGAETRFGEYARYDSDELARDALSAVLLPRFRPQSKGEFQ